MGQQAQVGVIGLSVMGGNLARNLARRGHPVAVYNRTAQRTHDLVARFGDEGTFVPVETLPDLVAALERPRRVVVMVKAGAPTDAVLDALLPLLDPGDVVVDGGNAHYDDTARRQQAAAAHGIHVVGAGISGGEEGALRGPSIMPGGAPEAYAVVGPVLESIAATVDGVPCCTYVGPGGAGHFVKMVHNGIEYAVMQLIAESYDVLRNVGGLTPAEVAAAFGDWTSGALGSYLLEISAEVLAHVDAATGRPFVDVVRDEAEQKGTGRWTVQVALELGLPVPTVAQAVFARVLSSDPARRAAGRALPGPAGPATSEDLLDDVRRALLAASVVAYAEGFDEIARASQVHGWEVDLATMAAIWRDGCIIRARLLEDIRQAYAADPALPTLLAAPVFRDALEGGQGGWRRVVGSAVTAGLPVPALSGALAAYDTLRRERSPATLLQGMRDYFGAHTYRRVDRDGAFHTLWGGDRSEVGA